MSRRQQSDALRQQSSMLVDLELSREAAALAAYPAEHAALMRGLAHRLAPLIGCVLSTADCFERDALAKAAVRERAGEGLARLRAAHAVIEAEAEEEAEAVAAETTNSPLLRALGGGASGGGGEAAGGEEANDDGPLGLLVESLEATLGCLGGVRGDLLRRRDEKVCAAIPLMTSLLCAAIPHS